MGISCEGIRVKLIRPFGSTVRRTSCIVVAASLGVLSVVSAAWACTQVQGITWYSDGAAAKTGPSSSVVTVFATNARREQIFRLISGNSDGSSGHEDHPCMFNFEYVNLAPRVSNARGFIPNTSGPLGRPPGEWQICFRQDGGETGTLPVFFTVV